MIRCLLNLFFKQLYYCFSFWIFRSGVIEGLNDQPLFFFVHHTQFADFHLRICRQFVHQVAEVFHHPFYTFQLEQIGTVFPGHGIAVFRFTYA
ncbi:hypothetical protein D3C77_416740 [compost metagenome]